MPWRAMPLQPPDFTRKKRPMLYPTDDLRITWTKVVLPPVFLEEELPATERASATVFQARNEIVNILRGNDSRLMVVDDLGFMFCWRFWSAAPMRG